MARLVDVVVETFRDIKPPVTIIPSECRRCKDLQNELNSAYRRCSEAVSSERDALLRLKTVQTSLPTPAAPISVVNDTVPSTLDTLEPVDLGILVWVHNKLQRASGTRGSWNSWIETPISLNLLAVEIFLATEIPARVLHRIAPHVSTDSIGRVTPASWRRLGKILQTFSTSLSAEERRGLTALAQASVNSRTF